MGNPRDRHIVINEIKEAIKAGAPGVMHLQPDLPVETEIGFEHLTGLFAGTTLDEYISTMNVRQAGYVFGLIRQTNAMRVIEVGRQWGGTTVVIAAALRGEGEFWSIADPAELVWDLEHRRRSLEKPVEHQLGELFERLGLTGHVIAADPRTAEVDTGEVDLVMIDGNHTYDGAMSDFERFGTRARIGGAVLFDDAVYDEFCEPPHTADVKRVVADILQRGDFRRVQTVGRLMHLERVG